MLGDEMFRERMGEGEDGEGVSRDRESEGERELKLVNFILQGL